ncbi:MAG: Bifunctional NAD(P)H-hydrate repair enzyme Nnr [Planctomycetes bacterium ADurb.Bin126]|nr:MAG: Bifunctional NAD(P)H-hydrate repair enzyme Nnr [Planctomycetes bacterium ADurb.Bin126]HOD81925.1 NAD(P)H-hydrate dehydratase [Phycisphaerae bacterium]HQL74140.1 NAD(P)H-hydrate dehydratase [Phycisphaerae bacterium]
MTENVSFDDVRRLPPRAAASHKGTFGRVLVVGGSQTMPGAVALATNAALRGGAGLATFAAPRDVQPAIASMCMCATSLPLDCDPDGALSPACIRQVMQQARKSDVVACGPGMGVGGDRHGVIRALLEYDHPLVLDADGLTNLAALGDWPSTRRCPLVVTPHPGEFARLSGRSIADVQADRENVCLAAMREWGDPQTEDVAPLVCVLKGHHTVVTDGRRLYVNQTGNPGMATGGSGDVLTGLIAAFVAQELDPFHAACLGVWCHGRAGDLAAEELGEVSMMASDLLDYLPFAIREVSGPPETPF